MHYGANVSANWNSFENGTDLEMSDSLDNALTN